jgi:DNA-binding XRE family transcriptional regulator
MKAIGEAANQLALGHGWNSSKTACVVNREKKYFCFTELSSAIKKFLSMVIHNFVAYFRTNGHCSGMITPEQCRAARALLGWSQRELAEKTKVSDVTIRKFELKKTHLKESTAQHFRLIFETNGVVLIDENGGGPGVRLEKPVRDMAQGR